MHFFSSRTLPEDESQVLGDQLEHEWNKELEKVRQAKKANKTYKPSLLKANMRAFGPKFALLGFYCAWEECILRIMQPLFMSWFVLYFASEDSDISLGQAYGYGAGIVAMSALYTFTHHQYFFGVMHTGMKLRVAHCSFIYRKALRLSNKALGQSNIGQMVNLLSNDVNKFDMATFFIHYLWCGPLQFIIVMYLTWQAIGNATFVGGALIILFVPLQSWIGRKFSQLRQQTAKATDKRIRLMSEIIQGIKVIKMYAWEASFAKLVQDARQAEIKVITKTCLLKAFNMCFFFTSSKIVMVLIVLTFVYMGEVLTAQKAFLTLALYNIVRLSMTLFFPNGIQMTSEALISMKRIENFLLLEEITEKDQEVIEETFHHEGRITVTNLTGRWNDQSKGPTLEDISFEAAPGQLTAIVGPVGSGKGSILQAVLGEMPISSGKVSVKGILSYASQEPWVFSGTLRQNVLFGQAYNADKYWSVLKACALDHDVAKFEYGDLTLVGERGVSLSGGQKARVNLARAIYRDADVYLLDDPLSAVDAHVGRHLFEDCIKTYLRSKVVILVTHQIQYLKEADNILVLHQGKITHQGSYETILDTCEDISTFLTHGTEENEDAMDKAGKDDSKTEMSSKLLNPDLAPKEQQEMAKIGTVSKDVYIDYVKSGANIFTGLVLFVASIGTHACATGSDLWISKWTNDEDLQLDELHHHQNDSSSLNLEYKYIQETNQYNMMVYGILVLSLIFLCATMVVQYFLICMQASKTLHKNMFEKLLKAQSLFFDTNPNGRILNRFSKDMGCIDEVLPSSILDVKWIFLNITCVFILVCYIRPVVIIPSLVVFVIFYFLRRFYLKTSRSVKRLEGITKSPMFSQLSASLNGLTSIRAFRAQDLMVNEFDYHQDIHSSAWFASIATTRWLGVYLDWIVVFYLICIVLSFLLMPSNVLGGDVGVAITSCIFLTGSLQYGMRQSAEAENLMTSVERVMEYGELASESEDSQKPDSNDAQFTQGHVSFNNVSLRYSEDSQLILKKVTFEAQPRDKVGIVGRTGAGKSSLIAALFRLTEPCSGHINIDHFNILEMSLLDLRQQISIIPQDPILFSSSLRKNLDPFDKHSDADIWTAIDQAHLSEAVQALKEGLETPMSEGGSNFSVGQRQLVCLARAILRRNKILVLDEATANVDPKTDATIQATIRTQFKDCTVFTVAHRLHTVMDSDKILVLDDGRVVEFDAPWKLLQDPQGHLSQLVEQTGSRAKKNLLDIANKRK